MKLSIIVPAHNEELRIGRMLDAYLPYFGERYGDGVEFLIVVNGSTDRTESVAAEHAKGFPQVRIINEPRVIGKGGALIRGFGEATGDLVGFVDADGATPPPAFDNLVSQIDKSDCIIASRWSRGAQISPRQSLARRTVSRLFNILTRVLFGLPFTDTQCGAKLLRRDAVQTVLPKLGIAQWAFDIDLLFQLRRHGYTIREIPTEWSEVPGSKVRVIPHGIGMFAALIRLRLMHSPLKGLVKLYRPKTDVFHRFGPDEPGFGV